MFDAQSLLSNEDFLARLDSLYASSWLLILWKFSKMRMGCYSIDASTCEGRGVESCNCQAAVCRGPGLCASPITARLRTVLGSRLQCIDNIVSFFGVRCLDFAC